jgi:protein SCO1/2
VTAEKSWIDGIARLGNRPISDERKPVQPAPNPSTARPEHPLLDYHFTNELARPVSLRQFRGQALAITFFYTRCPVPDYCPRLSKNFQEASRKLASLAGAPTNWHFLSVSIDPQKDTPEVLRTYAERYHYDSNHWTFLTGSADKIRELASLSGVTYEAEGAFLNHNFRTLIIDPNGSLRKSFPIGGNLSEQIAEEMQAAAKAGKGSP